MTKAVNDEPVSLVTTFQHCTHHTPCYFGHHPLD